MPKRRRKKPTSPSLTESELEQKFYNACLRYKLPQVVQQHKFHPVRNWRFDFSWPDIKLAVEIQGIGPGHMSVPGMLSDYEKNNQAILHGWVILYFMGANLEPYQIENTISIVRAAINGRQPASVAYRGNREGGDNINPKRRSRNKGSNPYPYRTSPTRLRKEDRNE